MKVLRTYLFACALALTACFQLAGYDDFVASEGGGGAGGGGDAAPPSLQQLPFTADRIDLLLVINDTGAMADKQQMLAIVIKDVVEALVNPRCVDAAGVPVANPPASPIEDCPESASREFQPVTDIHVGVITSSLGSYGGNACNEAAENRGAHFNTQSPQGTVASYKDQGFLAWDPQDPDAEGDVDAFGTGIALLTEGVGTAGCRYPATLEAWYRFLVDPEPYADITVSNGMAVPAGIDQMMLEQRRNFLRPDSLLAIVMLSDANDCSIRAGGDSYLAADAPHLAKPTAECADDPDDPCCRSCSAPPAMGCAQSPPECDGQPLDLADDPPSLRCYDQKRRFGVDFLLPMERYVEGLYATEVATRDGTPVANPVNPNGDRLVLLTAIAGVPWQDIARQDENGTPDMSSGLDELGLPVGGFQSRKELSDNETWEVILGASACSGSACVPSDPLMHESIDPRTGSNPVTGDDLAPPGSPELDNPINGNERTIPASDDLQYACIFPLPAPKDCSQPTPNESCDCAVPGDNPLCRAPGGSSFGTTQHYGKAYPSLRLLEVVRVAGGQLASICPLQLNDMDQFGYGLRPALNGMVEWFSETLRVSNCLSKSIEADVDGRIPCILVEVTERPANDMIGCSCDGARAPLADPELWFVQQYGSSFPLLEDDTTCMCKIEQLEGTYLEACQTDVTLPVTREGTGERVDGWCYVDSTVFPVIGDKRIVAECSTAGRRIRTVGLAERPAGARHFLACP